MFVHTHVYYANRFEPGLLFPDTIRLSYDSPMVSVGTVNVLDTKLEFPSNYNLSALSSNIGILSGDHFTFSDAQSPFFGHIGLYFVGAPKDFDLSSMMEEYEIDFFILDIFDIDYSHPVNIPTTTVFITTEQTYTFQPLGVTVPSFLLAEPQEYQFELSPSTSNIIFSTSSTITVDVN